MAVLNEPIQDTKCVPPGQVSPQFWAHVLAGAAISTALAGLGALALGANATVAVVIGICFAPFGGMVGYCDWFFNRRLVCLKPDEVFCRGTVISMEVGFDGDDTLRILLSPAKPGWTLKMLQDSQFPQAFLMTNAFRIQLPKFNPPPDARAGNTPLFVIEVEGTRMKAFCAAASVGTLLGGGLGPALFGGCVNELGGSFWAVALCFIISLLAAGGLAAIIALVGYLAGGTASTQDPRSFSDTVERGDCVTAWGRFVYDPQYDGWNEIHAVMRMQKLPPRLCAGQLTKDQYTKIVQSLRETESTEVRRRELNQDDNRFLVHRTVG